MGLKEQWIRPLDALPLDYQHVIAITSSGQEEEMYLVDDKWHIVDGVRIPIEFVVFWHEKREQPTVEMAEDCISREAVLEQAIDYGSKTFLIPVNSVKALPSVTPQPTVEMAEDCVSREAVIRLVEQYPDIIGNRCSGLIADIKHLPPVTPQPKRGKWKRVIDKAAHWVWECDDCKWQQRIATNFCPDCGADMREVQDER